MTLADNEKKDPIESMPFSRSTRWEVSIETSVVIEATTATEAIAIAVDSFRWPSGRRRTVVIAEPLEG